MNAHRFFFLIPLLLCTSQTFSQHHVYDLFPIDVGSGWSYGYTYTYNYRETSYARDTSNITGIVRISVLSLTETDTSFNWAMEERDSLTKIEHGINLHPFPPIDTIATVAIDTIFSFVLQEKKDALHTLVSSLGDDVITPFLQIFRFPRQQYTDPYTNPCGPPVAPSVYRLSEDSTIRKVVIYCSQALVDAVRDTLEFVRGGGLATLRHTASRCCVNVTYNCALSATLLQPLVSVNETPAVVNRFHLSQNYPNPFNPKTVVRYSVPSLMGRDLVPTVGRDGELPAPSGAEGSVASNVKLVVYDVLGREVAVLVNERKVPGSYEVMFDGSRLPSGVYFYRLVAGAYADSKRMILLK